MSLPLLIAASVSLAWDAVIPVDIYTVYVGLLPMTSRINPPLVSYPSLTTNYQVDGLDYGTRYFFVVTATFQSLESPYSNEVSYVPTPPPTPTPTPAPTPTPTPALVYRLWNTTVPSLVDAGADNPVQLGVKFFSDLAGQITAIRFYKSATNVGPHVVSLWSTEGIRLASVTATGETASGWQTIPLSSPVTILANQTYIASYHTTVGHYSFNSGYFASARNRPPLHAPSSSTSGGNGVYNYGDSSGFPDSTYQSGNYWVDVVFSPK